MNLEILKAKTEVMQSPYSIQKKIMDNSLNRIEAAKINAGIGNYEQSPFNAFYPNTTDPSILTKSEIFTLPFDGTVGGTNTNNVVHVFAPFVFGFIALNYAYAINKLTSEISGYTTVGSLFGSSYLQNAPAYYSFVQSNEPFSLTSVIKVSGNVNNPIVRAFSVETLGASGLVTRDLPTFFESTDQNQTTQTIKDSQITSHARAVIIVTQPQQLSLQICPIR